MAAANSTAATLNAPGDTKENYCAKRADILSQVTVAAAEVEGLLNLSHSDADKAAFSQMRQDTNSDVATNRSTSEAQGCPISW